MNGVAGSFRFVLLLVAAVGGIAITNGHAFADDRPNVVLFYIDDLGYGDLGCYGHPKFKTPRIDRLAAEGARFTQAYSACPYCAPSRAALLTGRYPFRSGVATSPWPGLIDNIGIDSDEQTLAEILKAEGYSTACAGKWHLGHKPEFLPTRHGFDEYLGILYSNDMHPVQLFENESVIEYPVVQSTLTQRYTQRALQFIDANRDRPFFLYFPHVNVHKPLAPSEEFFNISGAGLYGDVMAELDWSVGQVLDRLEQLKLAENTIVIFSSDNGPWYGGSSGGLRGMKGQGWEGGIRVPMIVRWPPKIPGGTTRHEPVCMIDVLPTVLAATKIARPEGVELDGVSILDLLTDGAPLPDRPLFSMQGNQVLTVRHGKWKLHAVPSRERPEVAQGANWVDPVGPNGVTILAPCNQPKPDEYPGLQTGDPPAENMLFDLEADPGEQQNVYDEHKHIAQRLRKAWEAMQAELDESLKESRN